MKQPTDSIGLSIFGRIALLVVILGLLAWFVPLSQAGGDFKIYMDAASKLSMDQIPMRFHLNTVRLQPRFDLRGPSDATGSNSEVAAYVWLVLARYVWRGLGTS